MAKFSSLNCWNPTANLLNTSRSSFWKHREPTGRPDLMITPLRDINDRIVLTRSVIGRSITQKQGEWAPFF